jgi:hypothetical protein
LYQTNFLKDRLKLLHSVGKTVVSWIKHEGQVVSALQSVFELTIGFPTNSLLPVPHNRILETTDGADGDSVAIQIVSDVVDPYPSQVAFCCL